MNQRFRPSGSGSFFGDHYIYDQVVSKTHFLRQLKELIPWEDLTRDLLSCYKGRAEYGPIPYHPAVLLKVLLLAYLYNLSERQVEEFVGDSLAAKYFVGLSVDQAAPDHSTLSVFRERILEKRGPKAFDDLFGKVVRIAKGKGIAFGRIQVVDATHSTADVDVKKEDERKGEGKGPRDKDAAWGSKGKRRIKTIDGKTMTVNKAFYGYKTHMSLNAGSGIVTSVVVTPGNWTDGKEFPSLFRKDQEVGIGAEIYAGDKGYDDGDNHELLRAEGKKSAICLNDYRTEKKNANKGLWLAMKESAEYQEGRKERYKIEQKNGEGKNRHGLGRCRYLGLAKYAVQALMTGIVMNLKRMLKLLCGTAMSGKLAPAA